MAESPIFSRLKGNRGRGTRWRRQILDRKWKYGCFAHKQWKLRNITLIHGKTIIHYHSLSYITISYFVLFINTIIVMIKCLLYFQIIFRPIKTFIIITLDPVPYYIYPASALLLVLNLLNLKPVSYGIPYQKDFEKSRTLTLLKLNCPFIWLTIWAKIYEH